MRSPTIASWSDGDKLLLVFNNVINDKNAMNDKRKNSGQLTKTTDFTFRANGVARGENYYLVLAE